MWFFMQDLKAVNFLARQAPSFCLVHHLVNGGRSPHSLQFQAVKKVSKTPPMVREWAHCFVESASISSSVQLILLTHRNHTELERYGDMDAAHRVTITLELSPRGYPRYRQPRKLCQLNLLSQTGTKDIEFTRCGKASSAGFTQSQRAARGESGPAVPKTVDGNWRIGA